MPQAPRHRSRLWRHAPTTRAPGASRTAGVGLPNSTIGTPGPRYRWTAVVHNLSLDFAARPPGQAGGMPCRPASARPSDRALGVR